MTLRERLWFILLGICSFLTGTASALTNTSRPIAYQTFATYNMTRYEAFIGTFGGNTTTEQPVNFGMMIYNLIGVYPDAIGQIAYVIIFAIPFVMMYIVQADLTLPALIGIAWSMYVFLKVPEQYMVFGIGCFAISTSALLWSLYKRY